MVVTELAGCVALVFESGRNGACFPRDASFGTCLAGRGHAGADGQFAGDEVGPTRCTTRFGVIVGEQHAFLGDFVEVRRLACHQAAVISADVPHADIVAHDDDDVGLFGRRLRLREAWNQSSGQKQGHGERAEPRPWRTSRCHLLPPVSRKIRLNTEASCGRVEPARYAVSAGIWKPEKVMIREWPPRARLSSVTMSASCRADHSLAS